MHFTRKQFFDGFRNLVDPTISTEQVAGLEFLLGKMESDPFWVHIPQIAYTLATVFHETAGSFQPVEEGFYLEEKHGKAYVKAFQKKLRYYPYYGRGLVQLTWKKNYQKAEGFVGHDLATKPQNALDPEVSYLVLSYGMHQGWFTGKKLDDYIKGDKKDYIGARHIINGQDKAGLIAGYARSFERILTNSAAGSLQVNPPNTLDNQTSQIVPTATDPSPSAPAQSVVAVPPVVTDPPEPLTTKLKNWYAALPAFLLSLAGGFWSWLQGAATEIIVAFFATAGIVAIVFIVTNFVSRNRDKQRDFEAAEKQKDRDFELTKIQLMSAADPNKQTVRVAPPPTELPNNDMEASQ